MIVVVFNGCFGYNGDGDSESINNRLIGEWEDEEGGLYMFNSNGSIYGGYSDSETEESVWHGEG